MPLDALVGWRENVRFLPRRKIKRRGKRAALTARRPSAVTVFRSVDAVVASADVESLVRLTAPARHRRPVTVQRVRRIRHRWKLGVHGRPARPRPAKPGCTDTCWMVARLPIDRQLLDGGADVVAIPRVGMAQLLADLAHTGAEFGRSGLLRCISIPDCTPGPVWRRHRPSSSPVYVVVVYERSSTCSPRPGRNSCCELRATRSGSGRCSDAVGADPELVGRPRCRFLVRRAARPDGRRRSGLQSASAAPPACPARGRSALRVGAAVQHAGPHPERHFIVQPARSCRRADTHI